MALVSTSIPNILNGVSQQPSPLRQITQGETQINAFSSVLDGLIKRPPSSHIGKVISSSVSSAAVHVINRGADQRHILVVTSDGSTATVNIFSVNGSAVTVTTPSTPLGYLVCSNPAQELKFLTVADTTFVVNTTKTVASLSTLSSGTLQASKKQEFIDLPTDATIGDIYEVIGDDTSAFDNFYVKALSADTYEETLKPGEKFSLDTSTMPITISPSFDAGDVTSDNPLGISFALALVAWESRTVGDLISSPFPSFVDKTLNGVFFFKNRLGFLSEDNVIFSATGDYFRFFPKTVTSLLADGPIDVSVSHTKVSVLEHAIAFNDSLTLFSDSTQFSIDNAGNLTPQTISILPSTEFENDVAVAPVGAGNFLYFATKKGAFSSIREYFIQSDAIITDALDITAHVPKFIPKNLVTLTASSNEDILVGLSSDDATRLYVYKWFSDGKRKLQSSWSIWEFDSANTILDCSIIENTLYIVTSRSDGVFLESIDLQYLDDTNLTFCVRADRKTSLTGSYDSGTDVTTWTLPYAHPTSQALSVVKSGAWSARKGVDITVTRPTTTSVAASGDFSAEAVLVGVPYTMTYQFSTQHVREGENTRAVQSGRLQLRTMQVSYEDTGFFKVQVTPEARSTFEYEFTGVVLNQASSTIEDVILSDGTFRFPIQSKNDRVTITIVSDSYLPAAFQSAEWEGYYTIRSRRI